MELFLPFFYPPPSSITLSAHRQEKWCAPFVALLRTISSFAAHHFIFCCPAFHPVVRKRFSSSPEFEFENGGSACGEACFSGERTAGKRLFNHVEQVEHVDYW